MATEMAVCLPHDMPNSFTCYGIGAYPVERWLRVTDAVRK